MIIDIIRHGESTANAGQPITNGPDNIPLTPLGHKQALAVAARIDGTRPPELIVVSPYLRTQQTAAPTITRFPHVPVEVWPVHEFTQLATHKYPGKNWSDRQSDNAGYWGRNDPDYVDGEGAESFNQLAARLDDTIGRLGQLNCSYAMVFSHGMFMRALFTRMTRPELSGKELMAAVNDSRNAIDMPNTARIRFGFSHHGKLIPGFAAAAA